MKVSTETLARFERLLHVPGVVRKRKKFVREEKSLETRRELLAVSFGNLPPRTDLDRVYRILERAKRAEAESFIEGFKIDQRRKLRKAQEKYSLLLRQLNALREKLLPGIEPLTDSLGFERVEWSGPIRRARPGHQEEPWLRVARKEFSVLKVPEVEDLFVAVGLAPYRLKLAEDVEPPPSRAALDPPRLRNRKEIGR